MDLDGTLTRGDVFFEGVLQLVFEKPWLIPFLLSWLARGRAVAKARLARLFPVDPTQLAYDGRVLAWLREEHARGRALALASASDQAVVASIAGHLGLFDAVFASDGRVNLKSARKAAKLVEAYPDGFVYAGNERADLAVWARAKAAIIANAAPGLERRAARAFAVERVFARAHSPWISFARALRPELWGFSLLVLPPLLALRGWTSGAVWASALIAALALACLLSAGSLIRDLARLQADRRDLKRSERPIASGALAPVWALAGALGLLLLGALSALAAIRIG